MTPAFGDARLLGGAERHLQRADDLLGHVVLDGEYVGQVAIIALRPEMGSIAGVDELRRDADTVGRVADAAFENEADIELAGDCP